MAPGLTLDYVIARHDYMPTAPNCILLTAGCRVLVCNRHPSGWWEGIDLKGSRGWFPSNYVEPIGPGVPGADEAEGNVFSSASPADLQRIATGDISMHHTLHNALPPPLAADELDSSTCESEEAEVYHDARPEPLPASALPSAVVHATAHLHAAARTRRTSSYKACANRLITAIRDTLDAVGCLHRTDSAVSSNPVVLAHRKNLLRALNNLLSLSESLDDVHNSTLTSNASENSDHDGCGADVLLAQSHCVTKALTDLVEEVKCHGQAPASPNSGQNAGRFRRLTASDSSPCTPFASLSDIGCVPHYPAAPRRSTSAAGGGGSGGVAAGAFPEPASAYAAARVHLRDAHTCFQTAIAAFRAVILAYAHTQGSADPEPPPRAAASRSSARPHTASDLPNATLRVHEGIRQLVSIIDRVHGSPPLCAAYPEPLAQLASRRAAFLVASSRFLASVRRITSAHSPVLPAADAQGQPEAREPGSPGSSVPLDGALAATSELARLGTGIVAAICTLLLHAQLDESAEEPRAETASDADPGDRPSMDRSATGDRRPGEDAHAPHRPDSDAPTCREPRFEGEGGSRRPARPHPSPGRTRSTLFRLSRKVTSLGVLRTASSAHSLTTTASSVHSLNDSPCRMESPSTCSNSPSSGVATPCARTLDALPTPSSPSSPRIRGRSPWMNRGFSLPSSLSPHISNAFSFKGAGLDRRPTSAHAADGVTTGPALMSPDAQPTACTRDKGDLPPRWPPQGNMSQAPLLSELDTDQLVRNSSGDLLGGTLAGLVAALTPSRGALCRNFADAFALTMHLFTGPLLVAQSMYDRYVVAVDGHQGDTQRANVLEFARIWLSEKYWRPEEDEPALPLLKQLSVQAQDKDLTALVECRSTGPKESAMRIFAPARGRIEVRRVVEMEMGASVDELYSRPWVLPGVSSPLTALSRSGRTQYHSGTSKLTDLKPSQLAQQLTVLVSRLWCSVKPEELLPFPGSKARPKLSVRVPANSRIDAKANGTESSISGSANSPISQWGSAGLPSLSKLSNRIVGWVAESVLASESTIERRDIIKHFVKVAQKCLELNNLHVFFALQGGLACSSVRRLKCTWNALPAKYSQAASVQAALVDPGRNHTAYRQQLHHAIVSGEPYIPFVGLALTDSHFALEGNAPTRRASGPRQSEPGSGLGEELIINWTRYYRAATIVRYLTSSYKRVYALQEVPEIQNWLATALNQAPDSGKLTQDERLYRRSILIEPRARNNLGTSPSVPATPSSLASAPSSARSDWRSNTLSPTPDLSVGSPQTLRSSATTAPPVPVLHKNRSGVGVETEAHSKDGETQSTNPASIAAPSPVSVKESASSTPII